MLMAVIIKGDLLTNGMVYYLLQKNTTQIIKDNIRRLG